MTLLATPLQRYFTDFARTQRELSPNTIAAYRDTWRLLIKHATTTLGVTADQLDLNRPEFDAHLVMGVQPVIGLYS